MYPIFCLTTSAGDSPPHPYKKKRHYHKIEHLSTANIGGFLFYILMYPVVNNDTRAVRSRGKGVQTRKRTDLPALMKRGAGPFGSSPPACETNERRAELNISDMIKNTANQFRLIQK